MKYYVIIIWYMNFCICIYEFFSLFWYIEFIKDVPFLWICWIIKNIYVKISKLNEIMHEVKNIALNSENWLINNNNCIW